MENQNVVKQRSQITGNAGLCYAAWQLSRFGWHVIFTVRNARGSDLYIVNDDESSFYGIQSKALSKRSAIPLGPSLNKLQSDWWILTINANSSDPTCYILNISDVKALANPNKDGKAFWLEMRDYEKDEFREAWHRLGSPREVISAAFINPDSCL